MRDCDRDRVEKPRGVAGLLLFACLALLACMFACTRSETPQPQQPAKPKPVKRASTPEKPKKAEDVADSAVGSMMPPYRGQLLDGKEFDLAAEKGNVVLLNLWATWCGPCKGEIPELVKMHDEYSARGFKVVGVSLDDTGADGVKEFVQQEKINYPIVLDPEGKLANTFQTSIIPTTVLIDKTGKIVWKQYGAVSANDDTLKKALDTALAAKS